jgi:Fe2+ transport system protein FeoA
MITPHLALSKAEKGSRLVVVEIPEGKVRSQLIRPGVTKGAFVRCIERLPPGGTVVIQKHRQEIAMGVALARIILVAYLGTE